MDITLEQHIKNLYGISEGKVFFYAGNLDDNTRHYYKDAGCDIEEFNYHTTEDLLYDGLIFPAFQYIFGDASFVNSARFIYVKDCIFSASVNLSPTADRTPLVIMSQKFLAICHYYVQTYYIDGLEHKEILSRIAKCVNPTKPDDLVLPIYTARLSDKQNIDSLYAAFAMVLFIMLHEYAHIYLGHLNHTSKAAMFPGSEIKFDINTPTMEQEHEADFIAVQWLLKLYDEYASDDLDDMLMGTLRFFDNFPSVYVILGLYERSKRLEAETHPCVKDRIEWIKEKIEKDDKAITKRLVGRLDNIQSYLDQITWREPEDMKVSVLINSNVITTDDVEALNNDLKEHEVEVGIPQEAYRMFQINPDAIDIIFYVGAGFLASGIGIDIFRETAKLALKTIWDRVVVMKKAPASMSVTFEGKNEGFTVTNITDKEQQDKMIDALINKITNA